MTCPNCGQAFEGDRCPNCGRPAKTGGGRIAAIVLLVFLVLPAALFGACSAYLAIDSSGGGKNARSWVGFFVALAVGGALACLGGIALMVKLWRK